ncbi:AAA family ATPase [Parvimonas parva]|uniref:AAA family ATPase n=1 Tax=Parvimonas parva TaxID=2769485 RepID=A0ABS1C9P2_9FIRM|nr:AAA family ATPase [Parvimonas parva]MBK1468823.1 AAA family ATPase [Parvimonas parva]
MKDFKFRLREITIENFKNVVYGNINLKNSGDLYKSSILGLYGQNGSGKTALIDSIELLKSILCGYSVSNEFCDSINIDEKYAQLKYSFELDGDYGKYYAKYEFKIRKEEILNGNLKELEQKTKKVVVYDEVLSCSFEKDGLKKPMCKVIDTITDDVFVPSTKYNSLFGKNKELKKELLIDKGVAKSSSTSFIFSRNFINKLEVLYDKNKNEEYLMIYELLKYLIHYANSSLFVIKTKDTGMISSKMLPLYFRYGCATKGICGQIPLSLENTNIIPNELFDFFEEIIKSLNIVLENIIPGITISMKSLGSALLNDGESGTKVELVSCSNGKEIPLKCESEGIKKIISVLQLLIAVYNDSSITVAIDELDSGIFEYLLGELLKIIAEKGKGQLIFTSHNLRPLEVLDKRFIAFTTTNPKNRYIRFSNIKENNNLRNVYFNNIVLGGQKEEIYKPTKSGKISLAFLKAGDIYE